MNENDIKVINTSYHIKMTDRHLAQLNFTARISRELWQMYIDKTSYEHESLGRIRFMYLDAGEAFEGDIIRVFGRVSHGYGYDIAQDIFGAIKYGKGVKNNG